MEPPATDDVVFELLNRFADVLHAAGRDKLRRALVARGMRVCVTVRPETGEQAIQADDMPAKLASERPATRRVYAIIRDARQTEGGDSVALWPVDIVRISGQHDRDSEMSVYTVGHALTKLRKLELAFASDPLGYHLGKRQPALPFTEGQSSGLPVSGDSE